MKKNYILYIIVACIAFSSCSKWLTIEPTDQVSEKDLYSDAEGFYNQVNGLYKEMATRDLYGRELSWGLLDVMAQYYNVTKTNKHEYKNAAEYNYEYARTKDLIESIWSKSFNIIANCNDLIAHIEKADSSLFFRRELERKLILGEAYAVRAFIHFDIARLFAPAPIMDDKGKYVPYVKSFPTHMPAKETTENVLKNVIADLELADSLTFKHDSIYSEGIRNVEYRLELQTGGYERYTAHRGYRFNNFAIKAMLARVHLYAGNKDKALQYAEFLLKLQEQNEFFSFTDVDRIKTRGNTKLYDDVIFGLYNNNLVDYAIEINISSTTNISLLDYEGIFKDEDLSSQDKIKDYRAKYQWRFDNITNTYNSTKFAKQNEDLPCGKFNNKMIPMIRMSEMLYIIAECSYATNKAKAAYMVHTVKAARGITNWVGANENHTQEEFNEKYVLNDLRKEAYGEGQLFYYYKRLNLKAITKGGVVKTIGKGFVLPIPDSDNIN